MQDAFPVADVLFAEWGVESVGMARGSDVGRRRPIAQHLRDGISGD